jgi:site-specific recombinase XerD
MVLNANSKKDLEDFKSYILVEKNFSKHTAKAYYADILAFLIWLGDSQ